MSALQIRALNFVTMTPREVSLYDLVFPDGSYLVKIPPELTPEELAPPLHWKQRSYLNVCVLSGTPIDFVETNRNDTGDSDQHPRRPAANFTDLRPPDRHLQSNELVRAGLHQVRGGARSSLPTQDGREHDDQLHAVVRGERKVEMLC